MNYRRDRRAGGAGCGPGRRGPITHSAPPAGAAPGATRPFVLVSFMNNPREARATVDRAASVVTPERFAMGYRYTEFPAIYHKARLYEAMQVARPGENREEAWARFIRDWAALQRSPFFPMWASAGVDEIVSALHERIVVGPAPPA